jgi:adenine-specific DNA-methyltransferase
MEKLDPKTDGATPDIVEQNIEKMKTLFPDVFTEGKVDLDALRETLGDYADDRQERYSFTWNGKSRARRIAQTPSTGTLRPCPEESVNWDTTQNLFIEGDNLEVLKLLQKSYHKKVKMIYIDPPYNTGKEFIYPDRFQDNLDTYLRYTGQVDDEGFRLSANVETSGRYHTNWLNMMVPRLKLARNLLEDDGVILISIDDNEITNLRKACDEVFGEENFVCCTTVISNPRGRQSDTHVASVHDYLLCYAKNSAECRIGGAPLTEDQRSEFKYSDDQGDYRLLGLRQRGAASRREDRPDMFFPIYVNEDSGEISLSEEKGSSWKTVYPRKSDGSDSRWMWGKEKVDKDMHLLVARLIETRGEFDIFVKDYLHKSGSERTRKFKTLWNSKYVNNQAGTQEVKELLSTDAMSYPKPTGLLEDACRLGCPDNGIVLDFFAGSCTTAHAVLNLNLQNKEQRRFIMVQLPEPTDRDDFRSIADIGKERVRRVIKKLEEERAAKVKEAEGSLLKDAEDTPEIDLGFKVFKLDASNIKPWDTDFDNLENALFDAVDNIKSDRSEADVLYELLLKYGLDLAVPIEERLVAGKTVYIIGAGALIVCLVKDVSLEIVEGIATLKEELQPEVMRVVFKDAGFKDDVVKTNAVQILHQAGIDDVKSL